MEGRCDQKGRCSRVRVCAYCRRTQTQQRLVSLEEWQLPNGRTQTQRRVKRPSLEWQLPPYNTHSRTIQTREPPLHLPPLPLNCQVNTQPTQKKGSHNSLTPGAGGGGLPLPPALLLLDQCVGQARSPLDSSLLESEDREGEKGQLFSLPFLLSHTGLMLWVSYVEWSLPPLFRTFAIAIG